MKRVTKIRAIGADGIPLETNESRSLRVSYRGGAKPKNKFKGAFVVVPKINLDLNEATWASAMGYKRMTAKRRRDFEAVKKIATKSAQNWIESRFKQPFQDFDEEANATLNSRYASVQQR